MNKEVFAFENQFAKYIGTKHAKMVNSGSSANLLMIASAILSPNIDLNPGDKVIVPAVSWSTTYFPLQQYGIKLIFVDVELETLNIDIKKVKKAIKNINGIKGILTVNLLGNPSNLEELKQVSEEEKIILFEDNCESFGASLNNKFCGTWGEMGTFSFFYSHHLQTMEGGMIVTDSDEISQYIDSLRAHGWIRTLPKNNYICDKTGDPFEDSFKFVLPGYSVRPLEMSGAIGQVQLEKWPKMLKHRRKNADYFKERFKNLDLVTQNENGFSSWFGFSIISEKTPREKITTSLLNEGIEIRPIVAGNFLRNPVKKFIDYEIFDNLKNSDIIHDCGFFLGNDSVNIEDKIDFAFNSISRVLN